MINSEINTIGATTFHKQPVLAAKKVALRDVQNNNSNINITRDTHQESLLPVEPQSSKKSGIKRHTPPDYDSPSLLSSNTRRKFEVEGNRVRNLGSTQSANLPQGSQLNGKNMHYMGSKTSVPRFKESYDDQMTERFIRLQNFIKQCDGSNHRENIQLLLRLSPLELSRHAVELEKRAIQLTIEEGQEMQRMQALNILGKPSTTRNPIPITQHIQHKNG